MVNWTVAINGEKTKRTLITITFKQQTIENITLNV